MYYEKIRNFEVLIKRFGEWPAFHDAEIISLSLYRKDGVNHMPKMELRIHHFQTTSETDAKGYFKQIKHSLTTFCFHQVEGLELEGFDYQNVVYNLDIKDFSDDQAGDSKFQVTIEPSSGLSCFFMCKEIELLASIEVDADSV
ncbi:hypothetical protein A2290_06400 [candidate division WOR-1 bacterium RIFOXYB2_FULL_36_35]|uniref:Uncharacterized protein n=1 Tax=candidate division WOR-1 bacterium RIFOXYB2_FULL_36_35 TaxID=1802578 RepID=A0A1F4S0Z4_UNCSA|nr:MAG: hypothetical protein A2290_06400 [candidate division WOR-1 bacterium RIFOXYB2_FULL_36_35]OGC16509.1 MAG: hypothetical protein A2282_02110 [candidate division WOR-1 bacterium RIFOXYA12_FULL_36_13]